MGPVGVIIFLPSDPSPSKLLGSCLALPWLHIFSRVVLVVCFLLLAAHIFPSLIWIVWTVFGMAYVIHAHINDSLTYNNYFMVLDNLLFLTIAFWCRLANVWQSGGGQTLRLLCTHTALLTSQNPRSARNFSLFTCLKRSTLLYQETWSCLLFPCLSFMIMFRDMVQLFPQSRSSFPDFTSTWWRHETSSIVMLIRL